MNGYSSCCFDLSFNPFSLREKIWKIIKKSFRKKPKLSYFFSLIYDSFVFYFIFFCFSKLERWKIKNRDKYHDFVLVWSWVYWHNPVKKWVVSFVHAMTFIVSWLIWLQCVQFFSCFHFHFQGEYGYSFDRFLFRKNEKKNTTNYSNHVYLWVKVYYLESYISSSVQYISYEHVIFRPIDGISLYERINWPNQRVNM